MPTPIPGWLLTFHLYVTPKMRTRYILSAEAIMTQGTAPFQRKPLPDPHMNFSMMLNRKQPHRCTVHPSGRNFKLTSATSSSVRPLSQIKDSALSQAKGLFKMGLDRGIEGTSCLIRLAVGSRGRCAPQSPCQKHFDRRISPRRSPLSDCEEAASKSSIFI